MNKKDLEKQILERVGRYYKSQEKAKEWYNTKHNFFKIYPSLASPKEMVNEGRGEEVWKWILTCIGY